jgi:hypothetical protein
MILLLETVKKNVALMEGMRTHLGTLRTSVRWEKYWPICLRHFRGGQSTPSNLFFYHYHTHYIHYMYNIVILSTTSNHIHYIHSLIN